MMEFDRNAPAWTLTAGDVYDMIHKAVGSIQEPEVETKDYTDSKYAFGLQEIAKELSCSKTTAWKLVHSGKIDAAISRYNDKIIMDIDLAIKLLRVDKKKRKSN